MARIVGHLPVAELEARYRAAPDVTEARHFQAIWLLAQGRTVLEASEVLAFVPRWAAQLAARDNASGQRLRPRGAGRPAAAQRQGRQPAERRGARRLGRAGAGSAQGRRGGERPQGGGLEAAAARAKAAHPNRPIEVWATDEHRLGLKPVRRRVWAPIGARPVALGHHRYQRLQVVAFVQPTSGETVRYLATGLSKPFFEALLASFARRAGAGRERHIVLVPDNAGWRGPEGLVVPEGISLVFLPPYSPELQLAEHLWPLVDGPVVTRHFATLADLEAVIAERCRRLDADTIKPHTDFHWWPKPIRPS